MALTIPSIPFNLSGLLCSCLEAQDPQNVNARNKHCWQLQWALLRVPTKTIRYANAFGVADSSAVTLPVTGGSLFSLSSTVL